MYKKMQLMQGGINPHPHPHHDEYDYDDEDGQMSMISQMYSSATTSEGGGGLYNTTAHSTTTAPPHVPLQQVAGDNNPQNPAKPRRRRKKTTKNNSNINGETSSDGSLLLGFKKRKLSDEQVNLLEKHFGCEHKLESERKDRLAAELGLDPRQVAVWFQNRRARWKNKKLEEEYSKLKSQHDAAVLQKCQLESELLKTREQLLDAQKEIQRLSIDNHHPQQQQQQRLPPLNHDQFAATSTNSPSSSLTTMEPSMEPTSCSYQQQQFEMLGGVDQYEYDLIGSFENVFYNGDDGYITAAAAVGPEMEYWGSAGLHYL